LVVAALVFGATAHAQVIYQDTLSQFTPGTILTQTNYTPQIGLTTFFGTNEGFLGTTVVSSNFMGATRTFYTLGTTPYGNNYWGTPSITPTNQIVTVEWLLWIGAVQSPSNSIGGFCCDVANTNLHVDEHNSLIMLNDAGQVFAINGQASTDTLIPIGNWSNFVGTIMTNTLVLNYPARTFSYALNGVVMTNMALTSYVTNYFDQVEFDTFESFPGGGGYTNSIGNEFALSQVTVVTVPEPDTLSLLLGSLAALLLIARKKIKGNSSGS